MWVRAAVSVVVQSNRLIGVKRMGSSEFPNVMSSLPAAKKHKLTQGVKRRMPDSDSEFSKAEIESSTAKKQKLHQVIEAPKQKMDPAVTSQCYSILESLMLHQYAWVFTKPVDPVELNIPDYFTIIKKPMDFETIKTKLENNMYTETEEFAEDVRLTFSNAMLYNPLENGVHKMAAELNGLFDANWESFEEKWRLARPKIVGVQKVSSGKVMQVNIDTRQRYPRTPPYHTPVFSNKSKMREKKIVTGSCYTRTQQVQLPKRAHCTSKLIVTNNGGRPACGVINAKPLLNQVPCKTYHNCASTTSPIDSTHATSSGCTAPLPDVQMSPNRALRAAKLQIRFAGTILKAQTEMLLTNVDKAEFQREKEKMERRQLEEKARIEAQIKAAEAAARIKAELEERWQRKQREKERQALEKCEKEEMELRRKREEERCQREKQRKKERQALEKMEKTVDFEDNMAVLEKMRRLCGGYSLSCHGRMPLERIGLYMKKDYLQDEDEEQQILKM